MIPLGILATTAGGGGGGSYELIETAYGTGSSSSLTFSSIVGTYKHLQIRVAGRSSFGGGDLMQVRFNSDTGSNYSYHALRADGGSVSAMAGDSTATMYIGRYSYDTIPGAWVCDILDYSSTSKYKTARALSGVANYYIDFSSGSWRNTAAITSITLLSANSGNFTTSTRFSLYGIKG